MRKKIITTILWLVVLFVLDGVFNLSKGVSNLYRNNFAEKFSYQDEEGYYVDEPALEEKEEEYTIEQFNLDVEKRIAGGIQVQDIPPEEISGVGLILDEYYDVFYVDNGVKRKVIFDRSQIFSLIFSPTKDKIGFFYKHVQIGQGSSGDISLVVMNISSGKLSEVYTGSSRTSFWEWRDSDILRVYYGAGTGTRTYIDIDVNDKNSFVTADNFRRGDWNYEYSHPVTGEWSSTWVSLEDFEKLEI